MSQPVIMDALKNGKQIPDKNRFTRKLFSHPVIFYTFLLVFFACKCLFIRRLTGLPGKLFPLFITYFYTLWRF
jgi:hypothetical protein